MMMVFGRSSGDDTDDDDDDGAAAAAAKDDDGTSVSHSPKLSWRSIVISTAKTPRRNHMPQTLRDMR